MSNEFEFETSPNQTLLFETEKVESEETYSPYKCARVVNDQFVEMGIEKSLPPQMFYTYVSKGYIRSFEKDGKKFVKQSDLTEWFVKYVSKNKLKK
jgi:hypothetical protein